MGEWMKIREACNYAGGVCVRTLRGWFGKGLKRTKTGNVVLIRRSWIDEHLERLQVDDKKLDQIVDDAVKKFRQ